MHLCPKLHKLQMMLGSGKRVLKNNKPNSKTFLVLCWYQPPHSPVEHFDVFESLLKAG